MYMLIYLSTK